LLSAALLHNPDLLLLDEPFSGLDVGTGLVLRSLIQELAARGKVVLFSSHELETVERVCSHVVILHRGKIVADDSIERLRTLISFSAAGSFGAILASSSNAERDPGGIGLMFVMVVQHFMIATTMLVVGLFAVLSWDATFPDQRDALVLAPLPVRPRTMFLAKV